MQDDAADRATVGAGLTALLLGAAGVAAYRLAGAVMEALVYWTKGSGSGLASFLYRWSFQVGLFAGLAAVTLGVLWQLRAAPRRSLWGNRVMAAVLVILALLPIKFEIRGEPVVMEGPPTSALPQASGDCLFEFALVPAAPDEAPVGTAGYRWVSVGPQAHVADDLARAVRRAVEETKAAGGQMPLLTDPAPLCLEKVATVRQVRGREGTYRPYIQLLPEDRNRMYELTRHAASNRLALAEVYEGQVQAVLPIPDPIRDGIVIFGPLAEPERAAEILDH